MLQFEFDIRDHKINNNESKGIQLALGISFLICAALFFVFINYLDFFPFSEYLLLVLVIVSLYFIGLLLGCKFLYPKEYLTINARKLTYKTGWRNNKLKIYLKDIKNFTITDNKLIIVLKSKEKIPIDLCCFSENAITVLKNYLNV
jgi:UDP-N-acetylmuramyl pentapeptide phosphotransferase/UDP-N-acetylglucosamine-1-phosphate transferase